MRVVRSGVRGSNGPTKIVGLDGVGYESGTYRSCPQERQEDPPGGWGWRVQDKSLLVAIGFFEGLHTLG
jgi:hypothetical protein